jgi:hypothetical protein
MVFFSSPPVHGTLRRYHAHPAAWLHKLPHSMTFEEGALLEPLSVALAGIDRAGLRLGDPLVICGAGPIGLVSLLAAHAAGAAPLVITDLDDNRLEMAKRLVPRVRTVKVAAGVGPEGVAEDIKKALGREAGLVLECTGVESSIHSAIYVSRTGRRRMRWASLTRYTGLSFWRQCFHHWRGKGVPTDPVHARFVPRDRHQVPIPVPRDISKGDLAGVGRPDRFEAAGHASIHTEPSQRSF